MPGLKEALGKDVHLTNYADYSYVIVSSDRRDSMIMKVKDTVTIHKLMWCGGLWSGGERT